MMRALFAAISGLRNHQLFMDTVGNNLANVNTTGYKSSRMTFTDLLSQTISAGSAPTGNLGGVNSKQIGLGSQVASMDIIQLQGSLQTTGKTTDLAIQGDGFFILSDGSKSVYTRDGAFDISADGSLVNPTTGLKVQGWLPDPTTGVLLTSGPTEALLIPLGQKTSARATGGALAGEFDVSFTGNLDSRAVPTDLASAGLTIVDSLGQSHTITLTFENTGVGTWDVTATANPLDTAISSVTLGGTGAHTLVFDGSGQLDLTAFPNDMTLDVDFDATVTGANDMDGGVTSPSLLLDVSKFTQLAQTSDVAMRSQNGFTAGTLITFNVGAGGEIQGVFSNGATQILGQLALAAFSNPGGLSRQGGNVFLTTGSSGEALIGTPGSEGRGVATAGNLEMSNVDLSKEFTNMIIGQRGFQANARVVTTTDEMLNDLVNLRR